MRQTCRRLLRFLEAYERSATYILAPIPFDPSAAPRICDPHLMIEKRRLIVREAWQIGEHEPELSCIDLDKEPIVPDEVVDPPINRALDRLRVMRQRRDGTETGLA